jgi:hypothetical protein
MVNKHIYYLKESLLADTFTTIGMPRSYNPVRNDFQKQPIENMIFEHQSRLWSRYWSKWNIWYTLMGYLCTNICEAVLQLVSKNLTKISNSVLSTNVKRTFKTVLYDNKWTWSKFDQYTQDVKSSEWSDKNCGSLSVYIHHDKHTEPTNILAKIIYSSNNYTSENPNKWELQYAHNY